MSQSSPPPAPKQPTTQASQPNPLTHPSAPLPPGPGDRSPRRRRGRRRRTAGTAAPRGQPRWFCVCMMCSVWGVCGAGGDDALVHMSMINDAPLPPTHPPPPPPTHKHAQTNTHRSGQASASCPSVPAHTVQGLDLAGLGQNLAVWPTPWQRRQKSVLSRRK
jgi:hypothetical protein